jgi:hypothetical protein
MPGLSAITKREIEDLKEAVCFLAGALVDCENVIIAASRKCALERDRVIRGHAPVVMGVEANELIVELAKHAPDGMRLGVLKGILEEKNDG